MPFFNASMGVWEYGSMGVWEYGSEMIHSKLIRINK